MGEVKELKQGDDLLHDLTDCRRRIAVNNASLEGVTNICGELAGKIKKGEPVEDAEIIQRLGECGGLLMAVQGHTATLIDEEDKILVSIFNPEV